MKARYTLGGYNEWPVPPGIARIVESSWTYTSRACSTESTRRPTVHRVLPHSGVSLVVRGSRGPMGRFRASGLQLQGAASSYRFFRPLPETVLVAVRLRPEWMRAVVGVEATELRDRFVALEGAPEWRAVFARLRRPDRASEVLASLEAFVRDRLGEVRADGTGATAHRALEPLRLDPSSGRVSAMASAAGVSERTLRRSVKSLTGMSPKWIHRVERLTRAVTSADVTRRPCWSDLAFRFGFSDQAHLVREARTLSGCTPRALHRERRAQRRLDDGRVARPGTPS